MSVEGYFSSLLGFIHLYPPCGREWIENALLMVGRATFDYTICSRL